MDLWQLLDLGWSPLTAVLGIWALVGLLATTERVLAYRAKLGRYPVRKAQPPIVFAFGDSQETGAAVTLLGTKYLDVCNATLDLES